MAKNKKIKHLASKRRKFEDRSKKSDPKVDTQMTSSANPFEFHRNKVKHNIIGRKLAKNEFGNKGVSRNRAFNKRKNTLLEEYKFKHKSGKGLQDLRKKDNQLIDNWKERNQSIDNSLTDNTLLTHKGKQLNDFIDDFVGSDDEDIDLFNRPEFVESSHFGGGSDGRPKSANEILDQIMDEKREKQMERAANVELTQKLDSEWSSIKNILRHKGGNHEMTNNTNEDFDILVKQLKFESTTKPISIPSVIKPKEVILKEEKEIKSVEKSSETLFKELIESFKKQKKWSKILTSIKNSSKDLLTKINEPSIDVLVEKYQTIIETNVTLSADNFGVLLIGTFFKETQPIVRLILIQILSKTKLKSFKEIAIVLVITKILLITSNNRYIPEVFNSILNVLRLTKKSSPIEDTSKAKNSFDLNIEGNKQKTPKFCVKYVFDQTLENFQKFSENQIKSMLLSETLNSTEELFDKYSTIPSFNELIAEFKSICSKLCDNNFGEDMKVVVNRVLSKIIEEKPKSLINECRPKPFILPMFEPKFDDKSNDKKDSKKKLVKKYNRELKGAKRELRKDSSFIRNTWINEIKTKDQRRKDKVKQIMGELSEQKGLYKKKK